MISTRQMLLSWVALPVIMFGIPLSAWSLDNSYPGYQPRLHNRIDPNGADMSSGGILIPQPAISNAGLSKTGRFSVTVKWKSNFNSNRFDPAKGDMFNILLDDNAGSISDVFNFQTLKKILYVTYGGITETYEYENGGYKNRLSSQNTLRCDSSNNNISNCRLLLKDGTLIRFTDQYRTHNNADPAFNVPEREEFSIVNTIGVVDTIEKSDGETLKFIYNHSGGFAQPYFKRTYIKAIESNLGWYALYKDNGSVYMINWSRTQCNNGECPSAPLSSVPAILTTKTTSGINTTYSYRDAVGKLYYTLETKPNSGSQPIMTLTRPLGGKTDYYTDDVVNGAGDRRFVSKIKNAPYETNYDFWEDNDHKWFYGHAKFLNNEKQEYQTLNESQMLKYVKNEFQHTTFFDYDGNYMPTRIEMPEGNYTTYDYDSRKNITFVKVYPKGGGTPQITKFTYPVCDPMTILDTPGTPNNLKYCNKPATVIDPRLKETSYQYYAEHGGLKKVTGPTDSDGVRPETRYEYSLLYAKVQKASTTLEDAWKPVYRLTRTSSCRKAVAADPASCVGTSDETVTLFEYYSNNNLLLKSKTVKAGNTNVEAPYSSSNTWQTESYGYDDVGNVVWVDGPRTDVDDKAYTTFDLRRRPVFEIGADPDGSGPLRRATVKHRYDDDGNEDRTDTGSCNVIIFSGSVPTGCDDFVPNAFKVMTFDSTGRLIKTVAKQP